jgi:SSS family solute:Na+ symporter
MPAWVAGLAFISTNLGALEVMGMTGSGAKYGMLTTHFYWIGAIPAMVFLAIFMMPFYYGSKARSVPEFLKLRYDEKTRAINAILFAIMTIMASGISMYALAILLENVLGWDFNLCLWASALIVLAYTYLGGLSSAIYNEVLQFFIIILGLFPLVYLGLTEVGGWGGLETKLAAVTPQQYAPDTWTTTWKYTGSAASNPMGLEWFGIFMGLGIVLSFGYWCTNFLIVQRAMAAESKLAAIKTPLIGAIPKMFIPFLIIVPGIIAMVLMNTPEASFNLPTKPGSGDINYDYTIIALLQHYLPAGVLGLGITALLASFMSGMAGNVSAFNTVWTYDIYQSYIRPSSGNKENDDKHYLMVGRLATVFGVLVSIAAAYIATKFNNIMDFLQAIFSMINAPLFAVIFLGMFWKRATGHAAFSGILGGLLVALLHHGLTEPAGSDTIFRGGWLGVVHTYPVDMAQAFWTAIFSFSTSVILTVTVSLSTKQLKSDTDLTGLVYSLTKHEKAEATKWYYTPTAFATLVIGLVVILSIIFW